MFVSNTYIYRYLRLKKYVCLYLWIRLTLYSLKWASYTVSLKKSTMETNIKLIF